MINFDGNNTMPDFFEKQKHCRGKLFLKNDIEVEIPFKCPCCGGNMKEACVEFGGDHVDNVEYYSFRKCEINGQSTKYKQKSTFCCENCETEVKVPIYSYEFNHLW